MASHWEDKLLRASYRRARAWINDHPIPFFLVTAVPPLVIPAGLLGLVGWAAGLVSLLAVPLVMFVMLIGNTHLQMLYEVRAALAPQPDERSDDIIENEPGVNDFTCELVEAPPAGQVLVRVVNGDATGQFSAKVMSVDGVDTNGTWPITARWLADSGARSRRISGGDSEVINLVRVRTKRAVDFLCPTTLDKEFQRVAAIENGSSALVRANLVVFNERPDGEGRRSCDLELTFANGSDEPLARLVLDGP